MVDLLVLCLPLPLFILAAFAGFVDGLVLRRRCCSGSRWISRLGASKSTSDPSTSQSLTYPTRIRALFPYIGARPGTG
ncbi:hypothetical protein [Paracidovorax cattleyae]|uniref:hypothetical protein n=1 Tax=Paracidovorax cattleyae TaxID=80868 RepID=UPI003EBC2A8F